jgi:hypothetical protein
MALATCASRQQHRKKAFCVRSIAGRAVTSVSTDSPNATRSYCGQRHFKVTAVQGQRCAGNSSRKPESARSFFCFFS